jgi:hypothetical protein
MLTLTLTLGRWLERYDETDNSGDYGRMYLLSMYWAFMTLTTTGYGDYTPHKNSEILVTIAVMFLGTCSFGYIIANITNLIEREDEAQLMLREKIASVRAFMQHRDLPAEMRRKVRVCVCMCSPSVSL